LRVRFFISLLAALVLKVLDSWAKKRLFMNFNLTGHAIVKLRQNASAFAFFGIIIIA
jgi:hypothetical protein